MRLNEQTIAVRGHILVEKFDEEGMPCGQAEGENLFLTAGINELWSLVIGASSNHFDNTNARIGIGDSSTAAAAGQTDLQAASNKTYKAMDASYPNTPAAGAVQFKATFGSAEANYAWQEFVVKQNTSAICIDRGVASLGTKAAGTTWVVTVTLTIA
jgi:hypothetical protein